MTGGESDVEENVSLTGKGEHSIQINGGARGMSLGQFMPPVHKRRKRKRGLPVPCRCVCLAFVFILAYFYVWKPYFRGESKTKLFE